MVAFHKEKEVLLKSLGAVGVRDAGGQNRETKKQKAERRKKEKEEAEALARDLAKKE